MKRLDNFVVLIIGWIFEKRTLLYQAEKSNFIHISSKSITEFYSSKHINKVLKLWKGKCLIK